MGCGASQPASENAEHPQPREKPRGEDIDAASSSKASSSKGKGSGRRLPISEGGEARDVIVLFGPPGAGKGSQAPHIVAKLNIPHISVGGIMRDAIEERTPLGLVCREVMEADGLITDDVVAGLIRERIARKDCDRGFVMDGFPRTVEQAQTFDDVLAYTHERVTRIVVLEAPDDVLERRVAGRWQHKASGRLYHAATAPPRSLPPGATPSGANMLDDETGEPLVRRLDDQEATLRRRLQGYKAQVSPVLTHYASASRSAVTSVDANQRPEHVRACVAAALEGRAQPASVPFEMGRVVVGSVGVGGSNGGGGAGVDGDDGGVEGDGPAAEGKEEPAAADDDSTQVAFQPLPESPTHRSSMAGGGETSLQPEPIAAS
mmetsp:Transcript_8227/g.36394  ORF Transcript_8227/g.36394 Transcript_8227/m.36394 type:complete len:376 (+) Transcript_8227:40-1167(+)